MKSSVLWNAYGDKLHIGKREFYRRHKLIEGFPAKEIDYASEFPSTFQWVRSCYNRPRRDEIKLELYNELIEGCGVESIHPDEIKNGEYIDYINVGDPYIPTIVYCSAWVHPFKFATEGWAQYIK
jgi:hypothetical protein